MVELRTNPDFWIPSLCKCMDVLLSFEKYTLSATLTDIETAH
jgi:hypothetical protein